MTTVKSFDHQIASRSSEDIDRVVGPEPAESLVAEAAWQLPCSLQAIGDDARWQHSTNATPRTQMMLGLQQTIGNQAVQRMLAQRRGNGSFAVDDETQARIHRERSSGQPLDRAVQVQMSRSIGHDFSGVRVHTSTEADDVSRQLGAIAFTTGQDVFFRAGRYDPASSSGQELLAHELAHVVQQSSGAVSKHQRMTVNPPGDAYEQAADAVARQVVNAVPHQNQARPSTAVNDIQREALPEEEEEPLQTRFDPSAILQREDMPEEEEPLQTKIDPSVVIQRQEMPEEEEEIQTKVDSGAVIQREQIPEEEEPLQTKIDPSAVIQRQETSEEEEEIQTKVDPGAIIQREEIPEEEEPPVQAKAEPGAVIQRQAMPEEEEQLQAKADSGVWVQRQDDGGAPEMIVPVTTPSVSGTAELTSLDGGDPYHDEAFGKWSFKADALTTADLLAPTFTTTNEKAAPAKGCDGCDNKDCFNVTATAIITFNANINVNLPSGSDFTDMKECEQKQIQHAIDMILKPHEQKHVAAFSQYKGKITKLVSARACREDVQSGAALTTAAEAIANAEGSTRSANARAASKKLDPFVVDVDLKACEDKQSLGPGGEQAQPSDVAYA